MSFEELEQASLKERVRFLGEAYVLGTEYYDDLKDKVAQKEIDEINYYIFSLVSEVSPEKASKV